MFRDIAPRGPKKPEETSQPQVSPSKTSETPAPKPAMPPFLEILKKPAVFIPLIVLGIILIGGIVWAAARSSQDDSAKKSDQMVAETTNTPSSSPNDDGSGFLPTHTCPDSIAYETDKPAKATYQGKEYNIRGEDMPWVDANCKQNSATTPTEFSKMSLGQFFSGNECKGSGAVAYTKPILAVDDVGQITPLGRMYDSHVTPTDHQYWQPKDSKAAFTKYPVYAPADGYIVGLERSLPGKATTTDVGAVSTDTEYRITIEHTCDFYTIFIHVHNLPEALVKQADFSDTTNRPKSLIRLAVKAGDQIGTVGGNTFDVTTVDSAVTLKGFVVPEHYSNSERWKVNTAPTLSYYTEPLKTQYYAKVSRSVEPLDGKIDYDLDGKLVGTWFLKGTGGYADTSTERYWDGHLTIAYNQHVPSTVMVSTGHFLEAKSAQFIVENNTPDPATVEEKTGLVKYKLYDYQYTTASGEAWNATTPGKDLKVKTSGSVKGVLLVQLQADKTLKAEFSKNANQTSFTSAAQVFER